MTKLVHVQPGVRFGKLTVRRRNQPEKKWDCDCDCGRTVSVMTGHLRAGTTSSCGCARKGVNRKHGAATLGKRTSEYTTWAGAKSRCYNKADRKYPRYGERGIVMCDRWRESFAAFLEDMGPRPSKAHSLDRIDNDGPYSPENCRWATYQEQNRNRSINRIVTVDGKPYSLAAAVELFCPALSYACVLERLNLGQSFEEACEAIDRRLRVAR